MTEFVRRYFKRLSILSIALLAFAAFGFSWATYYDWGIKKLEGSLEESQRLFTEEYTELLRGKAEYDRAFEVRNHIQVLELLKAPREMIQEATKSFEETMRQSIIITRPGEDVAKEIKNLHSYPDLLKPFLREQRRLSNESNRTRETIYSTKQMIASKESFRNALYLIFLIANALGLILSVFLSAEHGPSPLLPRSQRRRQ